jgi:hypothetical protein
LFVPLADQIYDRHIEQLRNPGRLNDVP